MPNYLGRLTDIQNKLYDVGWSCLKSIKVSTGISFEENTQMSSMCVSGVKHVCQMSRLSSICVRCQACYTRYIAAPSFNLTTQLLKDVSKPKLKMSMNRIL